MMLVLVAVTIYQVLISVLDAGFSHWHTPPLPAMAGNWRRLVEQY